MEEVRFTLYIIKKICKIAKMFPDLYFTLYVDLFPSKVGSSIDQKTDSVLEFLYGTIELWCYFV